MTEHFSITVSPNGATYATTVHNVNGMKILKHNYCMFMIDGHHRRRSVEMSRLKDGVK